MMQRSFLAITLAVLFTLSSVVVDAQQPEAWVPEEPTFHNFVKAMVLSVPTIAWRLVRYFAFILPMPLSVFAFSWLWIVTQEISFGSLLFYIAFFLFAPILSALSLMIWPPLICALPCLVPFSVYRETFHYFAPLAFPRVPESLMNQVVIDIPALCIALPTVSLILFSIPLALIALPLAVLFEIIWIPFIAPILLLFAIILRTQYQGIGLFIESLEKRADNFIPVSLRKPLVLEGCHSLFHVFV